MVTSSGRLACTLERLSHLKGFKFTLSAPPKPSAGWMLAETFLTSEFEPGCRSQPKVDRIREYEALGQ